MMTNLLASVIVTLVTNTTEIYPQHSEPCAPPAREPLGSLVCYSHLVPDKDPKEKWVKTEIVETGKIWFKWHGEITEGVINRPVTNWTTHFELEPPKPQNWIQSTNNVPVPMFWPPGLQFSVPVNSVRETVWFTNSGIIYGVTPN